MKLIKVVGNFNHLKFNAYLSGRQMEVLLWVIEISILSAPHGAKPIP